MTVGLVIDGEPGIDATDVPNAAELAKLLVTKLLAEVSEGVDEQRARGLDPERAVMSPTGCRCTDDRHRAVHLRL
ncbi:hypothetical protein FDO65_08625 [Nakamurella flava]|uniref:DhaK domain-containing protein n=1 Tax=Nakamurella flava TaxID=2576308 RepID=A0A4U6QMM1_9ACTN|nr:hypothetical protein [Nakamurella flava]TKV61609.1 hypothetical protein FDO65_08625 [Nakamurella flava]